jgi:hypothetical protein
MARKRHDTLRTEEGHRSERAQEFKVPGSKFKETGGLVYVEP